MLSVLSGLVSQVIAREPSSVYVPRHPTLKNTTGIERQINQERESTVRRLTKLRRFKVECGLRDLSVVRSKESEDHSGGLSLGKITGADGEWKPRH